MSNITTHVLDTSLGRPAAGVAVALARLEGETATAVGAGETNADGRVTDLVSGAGIEAGVYRLTFETAGYFAATGQESFYPRVEVTFEVADAGEHYHVPLLLSPYGYSTYRGS